MGEGWPQMIGRCQLECRAAKEAMNHLVIGTAQIQPQMSDYQTSSSCMLYPIYPLLLAPSSPWFPDTDLDSDVWARIKATRVLTGQGDISFMLIPALVSVAGLRADYVVDKAATGTLASSQRCCHCKCLLSRIWNKLGRDIIYKKLGGEVRARHIISQKCWKQRR